MTQNELEYKGDHLMFNAKRYKALFMRCKYYIWGKLVHTTVEA